MFPEPVAAPARRRVRPWWCRWRRRCGLVRGLGRKGARLRRRSLRGRRGWLFGASWRGYGRTRLQRSDRRHAGHPRWSPGRRTRCTGRSPGQCARRTFGGRLLLAGGRHHVDDRPDVQPRRLTEVAGLAALVARHGDDKVVAVDDHLGTRHAKAVHAVVDDRLRLDERVAGGTGSVRRAGDERDPGAALQVDAELGFGSLVPREVHEQISTDQQYQEEHKVAGWVHRRRRRCHVSRVSSRSVRQHRKGYVLGLSAQPSVLLFGLSPISVAVDSSS